MKNRSVLIASLFAAIVVPLLPGCGNEEPAAESVAAKPTVALVMKSLANEFFSRMADGAREHQAAHADRYELIVNGTRNESDLTQQVALIEQMIARRVDVIVLAPADSKALVPAVKRAMDSGIVVINIDNKLDGGLLADASLRVPFVGPDNREGAHLVGAHLATTLEPGDAVAIISGISTAFNAQQRQLGFQNAMQEADADVRSIQFGDWDQAKAGTITAALLTEHPDLKGVLCGNDNMAIGAVAAIRQAGKTGQVRVVGFDNIEATHELLRGGDIFATAEQYAGRLAVFGIEYALEILDGGQSPADRKTPVKLITAADLP